MPLSARTRLARRLRRDATDAEKLLWRALRENLSTVGFRRQHPIGPYITDFVSPSHKLVVELDGGQHADRLQADWERTAELARRGYRVIRFWNIDVMENLTGVLENIRRELDARTP